MKDKLEYIIYKIIVKMRNIYWRIWQKEQIRRFAECGEPIYVGKNGRFINEHIHLGNNVSIGENAAFIAALSQIYIGNNVVFAPHVTIYGGDHRTDVIGRYMISITNAEKNSENDADVYVEDDVWIGTNVTILKGVRIGTGSVIGAGSIVVKDVPPYTIHVGCPGVKDRPRFSEDQIALHKKMLATKEERDHV